MERISFTMTADNDGKITVKNVLEYIMQNVPQIKVPDADIARIPFADLTLTEDNTKKCDEAIEEFEKLFNSREEAREYCRTH